MQTGPGKQKSHWDKTKKENYHFKLCISFVCLFPVRLLLSSVAVLYYVNGQLQRAYAQTTQQPHAVSSNSSNRNSIFHSFGMWRGGGVYCRLTRQWLYLHRWFLKKYFLQIHFSYFFAFFFLLLGIAKISDTMI